MKKYASMSLLLLGTILLGTACSSAEPTVVDPYENQQGNANMNNGGNGNGQGMGQGQRADLMGQIKSINGNEIVLKVATMPKRQRQNQNGDGQDNQQNMNRRNIQDPNFDPNAPRPSFDPQQMQQMRQRAMNFTGEERTLKIEDGVVIEKRTFGENGMQTETLKLDALKVDDILQIWFDPKQQDQITRISIGFGGGGFRGGNGQGGMRQGDGQWNGQGNDPGPGPGQMQPGNAPEQMP
jgi:hypothetical protein